MLRAVPKGYRDEYRKNPISPCAKAVWLPFWTDHMALIYNRSLSHLAIVTFLITGCDVRDEIIHTTQRTNNRWPEPVTDRIDQSESQRGYQNSAKISFIENCDAGLRLADFADKPLLIVFRATWCRWSVALTQQTLSDPSIVSLTDNFICVQVDADRHAETCQQYNITQFPTILVVDKDGNEIIRQSGLTMVADLTPLLQHALSSNQFATGHLSQKQDTEMTTTLEPDRPAATIDTLHTAKSTTQKNAR